jgi:hypothetical protein
LQKWSRFSSCSSSKSDDRFHLVETRISSLELRPAISAEDLAGLFALLPQESHLEIFESFPQESFFGAYTMENDYGLADALAFVLPDCPALTTFAFVMKIMKSSSSRLLAAALARCPRLTEVDIHDLEDLMNSLPSSRISKLEIEELSDASATALCKALPQSRLKELRLDIDPQTLPLVAEGILACSTLAELNLFFLDDLDACEADFVSLCNGLPRLASLVDISINSLIEFPDRVFEKLLSPLARMKLETLSLGLTLRPEDFEKIAAFLFSNSSLHSLDLQIGSLPFRLDYDKPLQRLFEALTPSRSPLRVLRISDCALHKSAIESCLNLVASTQLTLLTFLGVFVLPNDFVDEDSEDLQKERRLQPDQLSGGATFSSRFPQVTDRFCVISWATELD